MSAIGSRTTVDELRRPAGTLFSPATVREVMPPSEEPSEQRVRAIVREEIADTARSLAGTVLWTLLSALAILVGLQLFQFAPSATSAAGAAGFALAGAVVTGASLYLLWLRHGT